MRPVHIEVGRYLPAGRQGSGKREEVEIALGNWSDFGCIAHKLPLDRKKNPDKIVDVWSLFKERSILS